MQHSVPIAELSEYSARPWQTLPLGSRMDAWQGTPPNRTPAISEQ